MTVGHLSRLVLIYFSYITLRVAGITWAFTIAIACLAFLGKFGGCTIASRLSGFSWREASTIGSLMSCKG